jgi:hypothetical protein
MGTGLPADRIFVAGLFTNLLGRLGSTVDVLCIRHDRDSSSGT